jgi:hypothetical protein
MEESDWYDRERLRLFIRRPVGWPPGEPGTARMVGRVLTPTAQISVGQFLNVQPVSVLGAEVEGGPGVITDDTTAAVAVYLVGSRPAQQGDLLVCWFLKFRWVAYRGKSSSSNGQPVPNCPCLPMPSTIIQTSNNLEPKYKSCTYVWGQNPAGAPNTNLNYYSQQSFNDPVTGDLFYYVMNCNLGFIYMGRWFPKGSQLGVYNDEGTIFQWLVGMPGNTCKPFHMSLGQPKAGVITPQFVTLSAP